MVLKKIGTAFTLDHLYLYDVVVHLKQIKMKFNVLTNI